MTTQMKFALKILRRLILYLVTLALIAALLQPVFIVIENQVALGQMQNSDEAYVALNAMNVLNSIRPATYFVLWFLFTCTIARDTHKFIKEERKKQHEKNNRNDSDPGGFPDDVHRVS